MKNPEWLPASTPLERALLAAAKEQHKCAIAIRSNRDLMGLSTQNLANSANLTLTTVRGYLNGSRHASLSVLTVLADAAGATLTTDVQ